ncbi:Hypothetical protein PHPALM_9008 [Phytophthora palmivora]|uniref:PiggyBac transposable element-derived protein domain-containing protein n=1 Tax=Phytophthora palmivora TaxID=4796 RepID=A0A2P4Y8D5_9STRA|nr:Hypothetical protein PHPALM_9008 [Phytophthora palmivora]
MSNIASDSVSDEFLKTMADTGWSDLVTTTPYDYQQQPYESRPPGTIHEDYPNIYNGTSGPTAKALGAAATPSGVLFYFIQPELWESIAEESNQYFSERTAERVEGQHAKQVARQQIHPDFKPKTKEVLRTELLRSADITHRELWLLIARPIVPNKEILAHHWRTTDEGAIPRGCTVRTDRQGLSSKLIPKKKKGDKTNPPKIPKNRPTNIERGVFTVAEALRVSGMKIHMLSTGGSVEVDRIVRRDKLTGEQQEVTCPRIVKDYQTYMGSVDVHDQLRLQRQVLYSCMYSLRLSIKYKKYYKSRFLGLVDLAIINAFIICNSRRAMANLSKLSHVKFLKQLHLELCQLREEDWVTLQNNACLQVTPSKRLQRANGRQAAHQPMQNDEWRSDNNQQGRKRRIRVCKVCSLLKGTGNARGGDSSIYCSECKQPNTSKKPMAWRVFLCEKMRHTYNGAAMSCFDIWHKA